MLKFIFLVMTGVVYVTSSFAGSVACTIRKAPPKKGSPCMPFVQAYEKALDKKKYLAVNYDKVLLQCKTENEKTWFFRTHEKQDIDDAAKAIGSECIGKTRNIQACNQKSKDAREALAKVNGGWLEISKGEACSNAREAYLSAVQKAPAKETIYCCKLGTQPIYYIGDPKEDNVCDGGKASPCPELRVGGTHDSGGVQDGEAFK